MHTIIMILIGVILTLGTALFVAAEFSLVALDVSKVEQETQDRKNKKVLYALKTLSTGLSSAQVGITITTILLGYTAQIALGDLFLSWFNNVGLSYALSVTLGLIFAGILVNLFSMIFGELVPKNIAISLPLKTARFVIGFHSAFTFVFLPVIKVFNFIANSILRLFKIEAVEHLSTSRSASELSSMVEISAEEGIIDKSTANIVSNSLNIAELQASDIMTDRGRVIWVHKDDTAEKVVELAYKSGHSRFPVYGENYDDILGVVNLRRAISVDYENRSNVLVTDELLLSDVHKVPETMDIKALLVELRAIGQQMAVVVDEYGGTSGIVTLEDAVEEIVGEVADESDSRRLGIQKGVQNTWLVPGYVRPDELEKKIGISLPSEGPFETVAGLFLYEHGAIPVVDDKVKIGDVVLKVESMQTRRIECLRIWREDSVE